MPTLYYRDPTDGLLKPYAVGPPPQTGRNRLINGDFSVNQRGTVSGSCVGVFRFPYDRWVANAGGAVDSAWAYVNAAPLGALPESARSYCTMAMSGQVGAGDYVMLYQKVEGVRTLSGKTATLSFWAKSSGALKVALEVQQHFGGGGSPSAWVGTNVGAVTTSTAWTRYTLTFAVPSIAGKTLGTNSDDGLSICLWTSSGSLYTARSSNIGLQNGTVDFWGMQLEEGPAATPYEQKTYAEELRDCQRYYQYLKGSYGNYPTMSRPTPGNNIYYGEIPWRVPPRAYSAAMCSYTVSGNAIHKPYLAFDSIYALVFETVDQSGVWLNVQPTVDHPTAYVATLYGCLIVYNCELQ